MKLIIGLGNPGKQYQNTRHNIGFLVMDAVQRQHDLSLSAHTAKAHTATFDLENNERIIVAKPDCFMNESGVVVKKLLSFYDLQPADLIICHDEIDLPFGTLRLAQKGSSAGHNGIESIIQHIHSSDFIRVRIGIGPQTSVAEEYVLDRWSKEQEKRLSDVITKARDAIDCILADGIEKASTLYNKKSP